MKIIAKHNMNWQLHKTRANCFFNYPTCNFSTPACNRPLSSKQVFTHINIERSQTQQVNFYLKTKKEKKIVSNSFKDDKRQSQTTEGMVEPKSVTIDKSISSAPKQIIHGSLRCVSGGTKRSQSTVSGFNHDRQLMVIVTRSS